MAMFHIWSQYVPESEEEQRRHKLAQSTWDKQLWTEVPVKDSDLKRPFIENGRILPRVVDLFDIGCCGLDGQDIVVFSNSDIGMADLAFVKIAMLLQSVTAGWGNRKDFDACRQVVPTPEEIQMASCNSGTDLFFFRVRWWQKHRGRYPDMVIAREAWDPCMRELMAMTNGFEDIALPNLCWHQNHGGQTHWVNNRYTLPGQINNRNNAKRFLASIGKNPINYGIR